MNLLRQPHPDSVAQRQAGLNRRHFLRGLGACLALPAFESLGGSLLAAEAARLATTATGAPLRTAFVYFPNGAIPSAWWPKGGITDFELNRTLEPLAQNREHVQILGGLDHLNATAGPDGGGDHARANGTFLTGVRMKKMSPPPAASRSSSLALAFFFMYFANELTPWYLNKYLTIHSPL